MAQQALIAFFTRNTPSLQTILLAGPLCLLWAYACLHIAGHLKAVTRLETGYTRKTFHVLIFLTVTCLHSIWGSPMVCLFGGMTSVVIAYALVRGAGHPLYEAMAREQDEPYRTYYIVVPYCTTLIGGLATNVLVGEVALVGYLVGGLGDAVGEPVGARWGRHWYRVPSLSSVKTIRSVEGSTGVLVVSLLTIVLGVALVPELHFTGRSLLVVPAIAIACTLVEAVSPHGWDNATMQLVPAALAYAFL